jgi:hypothetical protein
LAAVKPETLRLMMSRGEMFWLCPLHDRGPALDKAVKCGA